MHEQRHLGGTNKYIFHQKDMPKGRKVNIFNHFFGKKNNIVGAQKTDKQPEEVDASPRVRREGFSSYEGLSSKESNHGGSFVHERLEGASKFTFNQKYLSKSLGKSSYASKFKNPDKKVK